MNKIFLGGTCNDSNWRNELIPLLNVDYFNPVVDDWTPECQEIEKAEKEVNCNIHLYIITHEMTGVFSIAEAIESAMTPGKITIFQVMPNLISPRQIKSLEAVVEMVIKHGGLAFVDNDINRTARIINNCFG